MNLSGIFMYVFLCHLFIYCLSATNPPFCALLSDTGAGFYRLHFSPLASWLNVRPFQQRALERCCKSGRERRDYFFFQCFVFLLGGNWINMQGSWQCFLEKKVVFGPAASSLQHVPTHCLHRGLNQPCRGPYSEFLSFFVFTFPSTLGVVTALCSYYFRVLLYLFQ